MRRRLYSDRKLSKFLCSYLAISLMLLNVVPFDYAAAMAAESALTSATESVATKPTTTLIASKPFATAPAATLTPTPTDAETSGLSFSLVESKAPIEKPVKVPSAPAEDLPAERVDEIFQRLSPLTKVDKKAFVLPEDSLVRPKIPGIQTLETFPPKDGLETREKPVVDMSTTPLTVRRVSHSGVVDTVTQFAMTFSQPMVPVSEARAFPSIKAVEMKPQPKGNWKWAGPQTVLFEPEGGRLPKSTEYVVTVPAGTESANGAKSVKAQSWTITTPTARVTNFYPNHGPQDQTPVLVAVFDQDIDRVAVLKNTRVSVGREEFAPRLVDDATVEKNATLKSALKDVPAKRWIAFRAENPLPYGSSVKVSFLPGTPSLEGPLKTEKAQDFTVAIYGPLRLVRGPEPNVSPERWAQRRFFFSNPIDTAKGKFDEKMIKITPTVDGAEWRASHTSIWLTGRLKPFTKYTVVFDKNIADTFGQTLGRDTTTTFTTGALNMALNDIGALNTFPYGQKPIVSFFAQAVPQVRLTVYKATPSEWPEYVRSRYNHRYQPPNKIATKTFKVGDEDVKFDYDLTPHLKNGLGQFIISAETVGAPHNRDREIQSWIQVTKIGIDAFQGKNLLALATSLADGTPLQGVDLTSLNANDTATTDANGLAKLPLSSSDEKAMLLVARKGDDVAFVPATYYRGGWTYHSSRSELKWFTVTDRQLYKPGEKVTVKGWTRGMKFSPNEAIQLFPAQLDSVTYKLNAYDGTELISGEAPVDSTGGFSFEATLPEKMNLGDASLILMASSKKRVLFPGENQDSDVAHYFANATTYLPIKIQEFRRPEFEMNVASSSGNSILLGDTTSLTAKTQYFAGGVLQDAPIIWSAAVRQSQFSPPGWSDFSFGQSRPFWSSPVRRSRGIFPQAGATLATKSLSGITDATGAHTVDLKFEKLKEPFPVSASCEATVNDVNRQSWSDKVSILIHPADTYVGVKPAKWFFHKGEPVEIRYIATDLDGKAKPGSRVVVKLLRVDKDGKDVEVARQNLSSAEIPQAIKLVPKEGGQHFVVATVFDDKERANETRVSTWIEGDTPALAQKAELQNIVLIPDRKEYQPGDSAEIMIASPFSPSHGVVTVRRNTIVSTIPVNLDSSSKTVKIPITQDYYPNVTVEVYLTGKNATYASGTVELKVPPRARTLTLQAVASQKELSPGGDTTIDINLKHSDGKPVRDGKVTLMVADESILALADYKWPDPIDVFYPASTPNTQHSYLRQSVIKPQPQPEQNSMDERGGGAIPPASPMPVATRAELAGGEIGRVEGPRDTNLFQVSPTMSAFGQARQFKTAAGQLSQLSSVDHAMPSGGVFKSVGTREQAAPITVRTNFAALALFVPTIATDENGKAQVKLHLPDSLTRYRIMAAAIYGDDSFGSTESNVTARLPLMVKPSAPRFLHFGDKCELPVVLQNQTDKPLKVEVVIRADNAQLRDVAATRNFERQPRSTVDDSKAENNTDTVDGANETNGTNGTSGTNETNETNGTTSSNNGDTSGGSPQVAQQAGKVVEVPANNRVEVRFPVSTVDEGKANFQCAAVSGGVSDASEFSVPVLVPATMESFAAYGQIDKGAVLQKLDRPKDVYEQVGGLSISTSSTAVQSLTDAYFYLKNYSYGCSEQISSRMIAMLSLQDVLVSFGKLKGSAQAEFTEFVKKDIAELLKRQNSDGSFGLWKAGEHEKWPYVSIQVAQALDLAKDKDYQVDPEVLRKSEHFLKNIASYIPKEYSERTKIAIEARALNVRYRMNDVDASAARRLIQRSLKAGSKSSKGEPPRPLPKMATDKISNDLSLECAGWLLPIISGDKDSAAEVQLIRKMFDASIKETASTASTNDVGYGDWGYCIFYSPRRTDAIVLEALMADQPQSELIPKMVRGLLAHRKNGAWEGPQENGYILQALDKYFGKYESQTPNFESQTWLGETLVGLQKFVGRSTETKTLNLPMSFLAKRNDSDLVINKVGAGRLYYRIGLDYAPKNLVLKPADFGFTVERTYEAVDDVDDVKQDDKGVWHFKSGATVRTKLKFSNPGARYHVAMMDPLPAGAEPLNPDLSGSITQVPPKAQSTAPSGGRIPTGRGGIVPLPLTPVVQESPYIWWWPRNWFEHQNLRDHQAEAFQSLLYAGKYDYTYLMRATTPGDYIVPPTKLEEMYMPETFGRSGSDHVVIE